MNHKQLAKIGIPVAMTAQIDSIGLDAKVSKNVGRAFNFYFPGAFFTDNCPVQGEDNIKPVKKKPHSAPVKCAM